MSVEASVVLCKILGFHLNVMSKSLEWYEKRHWLERQHCEEHTTLFMDKADSAWHLIKLSQGCVLDS